MVNSLPCQVETVPLHPINTLSGQVRVTPCKSEGIEPFILVNPPPGQVGVTPCKSEGIEPFTLVNSLPGQVRVTPHKLEGIEPFTMVNSPPFQVKAASSHLINTLLGPLGVASPIFSTVPASASACVTPVLSPSLSVPVSNLITYGSSSVTSPHVPFLLVLLLPH